MRKYISYLQYVSVRDFGHKKPKVLLDLFSLKEATPTNDTSSAYIVVGDDDENVGYVQFRENGQIGALNISQNYRGYGLGPQLLKFAGDKIKTNEMFVVCSKDNWFWKSRQGAYWTRPAGEGCTSGGYRFINKSNVSN